MTASEWNNVVKQNKNTSSYKRVDPKKNNVKVNVKGTIHADASGKESYETASAKVYVESKQIAGAASKVNIASNHKPSDVVKIQDEVKTRNESNAHKVSISTEGTSDSFTPDPDTGWYYKNLVEERLAKMDH